jgi:hypothetical protein
MSKMSDLILDIQGMLEDDVHPTSIARQLGVPLTWVYDALEQMEPDEEESFSPFETCNS